MMKPKVTIGVCVRNCENFIKEAINSVMNQDFPPELMEVIFVDDGSEDKTLSIIKTYIPKMDMQLKVFHQEWKGLGTARNVVVNNANGEHIIWVDCDMRLSRDFVRKQVGFMEKNPTAGIGKGKYGMYTQADLVVTLENMDFLVDNFQPSGKTISSPLGTGGSIYRVKAIRQIGGFDQNITGGGEDLDAEFRISEAGWLLCGTQAVFYEMRRRAWKALWDEYFWQGYGVHYFVHKNGTCALPRPTLYKMFPPVGIFEEILRSFFAYKFTRRKVMFLLPLHWTFKRIAWCVGFAKGHMKGYGHTATHVI